MPVKLKIASDGLKLMSACAKKAKLSLAGAIARQLRS